MLSKGFVYFIQAGTDGPIKIGYSANPHLRFDSLQTAHYEQLNFLGRISVDSPEVERLFHKRLKAYKIRGEWFSFTDEVVTVIRAALDRQQFPYALAVPLFPKQLSKKLVFRQPTPQIWRVPIIRKTTPPPCPETKQLPEQPLTKRPLSYLARRIQFRKTIRRQKRQH